MISVLFIFVKRHAINFRCACYIAVNETLTADGEKGLLVPAPSDLETTIVNMNDADDVLPEANLLDVQAEDTIEVENAVEAVEPVSGKGKSS